MVNEHTQGGRGIKDYNAVEDLRYEDLGLAEYVHNTTACTIGGIDITVEDLYGVAAIAGIPVLSLGHSEKGKTFAARQINNQWFGGTGKLVQAASLDEITELFTSIFKRIDIDQATWVVDEESTKSPFMFIDEIGAIPKPLKQQFYPIGDGFLPHKGTPKPLGIPLPDGSRYHFLLASTNTIRTNGNGDTDYGNFGVTKAEASRYRVCLDLRRELRRDPQSLIEITLQEGLHTRYGDDEKPHDITDKIIKAHLKVKAQSKNPSIEELVALQYLGIGTGTCTKGSRYEDTWMDQCIECEHTAQCPAQYFYMYEMMRTNTSIRVFANALVTMAMLKDPRAKIPPERVYDAVFEAARFVITGKYGIVNTHLQAEKKQQEGEFIKEGLQKMKDHFMGVQPDGTQTIGTRHYVDSALDTVKTVGGEIPKQFVRTPHGILPLTTSFFEAARKQFSSNQEANAEKVKEEILKEGGTIEEPFHDQGFVDTSWIPTLLEGWKKRKEEKNTNTGGETKP